MENYGSLLNTLDVKFSGLVVSFNPVKFTQEPADTVLWWTDTNE